MGTPVRFSVGGRGPAIDERARRTAKPCFRTGMSTVDERRVEGVGAQRFHEHAFLSSPAAIALRPP
ncbi:hypothetical protein [Streptomyces sp. NPDC056227]|uniref:hypothetical protein n=1 Tax=Streptomyces sp. NPDC056227 TaxID=3345753 RepID=UPI0035DA97DD